MTAILLAAASLLATPTLVWEMPTDVKGHKVYWKEVGGPGWRLLIDLPCSPVMIDTDGDGLGDTPHPTDITCPGYDASSESMWFHPQVRGGLPWPLVRADLPAEVYSGRTVEYAVSAYNDAGESGLSNPVTLRLVGLMYLWEEPR